MPTRNASAIWRGSLPEGTGQMSLGSGAFEGAYSFASRFADGSGTNPEELIGAAHAGCYSMALSGALSKAGYEAESIQTTAEVHLIKDAAGFTINQIDLHTTGIVPGIGEEEFVRVAEEAKANCPVSRALAAIEITLAAKLAA